MIKFAIAFLALTGFVSILSGAFSVEFDFIDYWTRHGFFFLIFIALFPRLTLIFSSVPFGGFFWWLGLIFAPRFLVAILATVAYWNTNKVLVIFAWIIAWGGESTEKNMAINRTMKRTRFSGETIDAEFVDLG